MRSRRTRRPGTREWLGHPPAAAPRRPPAAVREPRVRMHSGSASAALRRACLQLSAEFFVGHPGAGDAQALTLGERRHRADDGHGALFGELHLDDAVAALGAVESHGAHFAFQYLARARRRLQGVSSEVRSLSSRRLKDLPQRGGAQLDETDRLSSRAASGVAGATRTTAAAAAAWRAQTLRRS